MLVLECLRHALGFKEVSDERYKSGLVERMLSPAGKVIVEATEQVVTAFQRHWRQAQVDGVADGATRAQLIALLRSA